MNRNLVDNLMLVVPLKTTSRYEINKPLTKWVDSNPDKLNRAITRSQCRKDLLRFSSLRNCLSSSVCTHYAHSNAIREQAMEDCMEYHAILIEGENLGFPVEDEFGQTDLNVSWNCAFQRNGQKMKRSNIRYERICVLFNIAAFETYLATKVDFFSKPGLQSAIQRYNAAAGIMRHIRTELLPSKETQKTSLDLSRPCLEMCEKIALAQAQACVYEFSKYEFSNNVLAKIAMGACELYGEAILVAEDRMIKTQMEEYNSWMRNLKIQSATFRALAEYYQALIARESKSHGKELARLQLTDKLCEDGLEFGRSENLQALKRIVQERITAANKDNNEIYREVIPNPRALPGLSSHRIAKCLPLDESLLPSKLSQPIFQS